MLASLNGAQLTDGTSRREDPQATGRTLGIPEPGSVEAVGIDFDRLVDLALKTFLVTGQLTARDLADSMALPAFLAQQIVDHLRRSKLADAVAAPALNERQQRYALTSAGRDTAHAALQRNRYVGPTPVPLETYREVVQQSIKETRRVSRDQLKAALSRMVLSPRIIDEIGPAIQAGRSLFIHGSSGNGKTTLAEALGLARDGTVLVPYAIEAKGEIIRVYDASVHNALEEDADGSDEAVSSANLVVGTPRRDRRWARIRRPLLVAGGELTVDQLELTFNPDTGIHQAPLQLKANGGTLLIDDFGRQRVRPSDLLNRWIVPLEKGYDHLRLTSGDVIEVPFNTLVIFSTNLTPRELVDEAFMRRIKYTVELPDPSPEQYREIFCRCCEGAGLACDAEVVSYLLERYYRSESRPTRSCHPRDIIERICDRAQFEGHRPVLDREAVDWACQGYFQLHG